MNCVNYYINYCIFPAFILPAVQEMKAALSSCFFFRDFIENGVLDYATKNPSTVVYVAPQSCRIPKLVAEYRK